MQKRLDIEASHYKKTTQLLKKEEEELDKEIKKEPNYLSIKEEYDKTRSEWKKELDK